MYLQINSMYHIWGATIFGKGDQTTFECVWKILQAQLEINLYCSNIDDNYRIELNMSMSIVYEIGKPESSIYLKNRNIVFEEINEDFNQL